MYVYIYLYVYIYIYIYIYVCILYIFIIIFICMYIYIYIYIPNIFANRRYKLIKLMKNIISAFEIFRTYALLITIKLNFYWGK